MLALGISCFVHYFCMDVVTVIVMWGPKLSFKISSFAKTTQKWATGSSAVRKIGSVRSNSKGYFHAQNHIGWSKTKETAKNNVYPGIPRVLLLLLLRLIKTVIDIQRNKSLSLP